MITRGVDSIKTAKRLLWRAKLHLECFGLRPSLRLAWGHLRLERCTGFPPRGPSVTTALVTFSAFPELTELWLEFAAACTDPHRTEIFVLDSSGRLRVRVARPVQIVPCWNVEHGRKIDLFVTKAGHERVWLCDDDVFLLSPSVEQRLERALEAPDAWAASLMWREQKLTPDGPHAMGSSCLMFKREVPLRHGWSFRVRATQDSYVNWGRGWYDTCDYAHAQSLSAGYRVVLLERDESLAPFIGVTAMYLKLRTEIRDANGFWNKFRSYKGDTRKARLFLTGAFSLLRVCQLYERFFHARSGRRYPSMKNRSSLLQPNWPGGEGLGLVATLPNSCARTSNLTKQPSGR